MGVPSRVVTRMPQWSRETSGPKVRAAIWVAREGAVVAGVWAIIWEEIAAMIANDNIAVAVEKRGKRIRGAKARIDPGSVMQGLKSRPVSEAGVSAK